MKRIIIVASFVLACTIAMQGQGVLDVLPSLSNQLNGTARYSAMGGAFGALGGDITTIQQNPAGIGVYRSSEITVTGNFNFFFNSVETPSSLNKNNDFYFSGDNMGVVGAIKFKNGALRNLNFAFAYNNIATFNNVYSGHWYNISSSLTQMMANKANVGNFSPSDLAINGSYNPYLSMPWLPTLAYNTNLIHSIGNGNSYSGIFMPGKTTGSAHLVNYTAGTLDEYDFNISGNVNDNFYWGLTLNVTSLEYTVESFFSEELNNAYVRNNFANTLSRPEPTNGRYELQNYLHTSGIGMGAKIGIIYRPVSFLRLGAAFHSPTYYQLSDTYSAAVDYHFANVDGNPLSGKADHIDNQTDIGNFSYQLSTPWHAMLNTAVVLGKSAIISADYEYIDTPSSQYSSPYTDYNSENLNIKNQMIGVHNLRIGAEYRVTPMFSLRAGYAWETSPLKEEYVSGGKIPSITEGTLITYQIPDDAHYFTCGLGYRFNNFSIDAAYVHRMQKYNIIPYEEADYTMMPTIMDMRHNSVKISLSYRF